MSEITEKSGEKYSTWIHISFNLSHFITKSAAGMFLATIFYFYETEILLPTIFVGLANIIFFIWDALNDPLVGFISDQPNPMWKKWGRRFPWIMIGGIPTGLTLILLYAPPNKDPTINPWPVFIWFLVFLFLHELFYTMSSCNIMALYPEKFSSESERNKNTSIGQLLQRLANVIGTVIPMILIIEGDKKSYLLAAIILVGIGAVFFLLGIPGVKESKEMIEKASKVEEKEPFFKTIKEGMSSKNFRSVVAITVLNTTFNACLISSILYWVHYVLVLPDDSQGKTILTVVWFVTVIVAIPIWNRVIAKIGNKNTMIISLISSGLASFVVLFVTQITGAIISMVLLGATMSGTFISIMLMFADSVDEANLNSGKRKEGIFAGVFTFFDRIGYIIQTLIFTVVHIITNFDPKETITPLAKGGLIAAFTWIPAIGLFIAAFIAWKVYDLSPKKIIQIKQELKELGI
ncbi:MAG: MFS transporter [Promethearchaeota archaeon]